MNKMQIAQEFAAIIYELEDLAEEAISTAENADIHDITTYNDGKAVAFTKAIEMLKSKANSLLN